VTGESLPVQADIGTQVFAGTLNLGEPLVVRATATGGATDATVTCGASADPDLADTARLVRAEIAGGGALPSWRIAQKQLTLTNEGVRSLGIAPVVISDETEAPTFTDIIFDQQDGAALDEAAENDAGGDGATEGLVRP